MLRASGSCARRLSRLRMICSCVTYNSESQKKTKHQENVAPFQTFFKSSGTGCDARAPSAASHHSNQRRYALIFAPETSYQRYQSSGPDHVNGLREKVIVNGSRQVRTSAVYRIINRIIS